VSSRSGTISRHTRVIGIALRRARVTRIIHAAASDADSRSRATGRAVSRSRGSASADCSHASVRTTRRRMTKTRHRLSPNLALWNYLGVRSFGAGHAASTAIAITTRAVIGSSSARQPSCVSRLERRSCPEHRWLQRRRHCPPDLGPLSPSRVQGRRDPVDGASDQSIQAHLAFPGLRLG
jgi:hypothetical protein